MHEAPHSTGLGTWEFNWTLTLSTVGSPWGNQLRVLQSSTQRQPKGFAGFKKSFNLIIILSGICLLFQCLYIIYSSHVYLYSLIFII